MQGMFKLFIDYDHHEVTERAFREYTSSTMILALEAFSVSKGGSLSFAERDYCLPVADISLTL